MFKAAVLRDLRKPLEIVDGVGLTGLNNGQVLVQVAYSGVCHSQVMEVEGLRGDDPHLPHMLGHEGTGVVREIGGGVTKVAPGDRVILGWIRGLGLDGGPVQFNSPIGPINAGRVTTFSEYTVVSENRVTKLPAGIDGTDRGVELHRAAVES
ncbi:MAG: alcohol dehydrogenase catalytic domain-containing protein, partial [Planctomycetaceae bacterium]